MSNLSVNSFKPEFTLWLEQRGITVTDLANVMGISRQYLTTILSADFIPAKRHKQLSLIGVPKEILPPIFVGHSGRPPKKKDFQPFTQHISRQGDKL